MAMNDLNDVLKMPLPSVGGASDGDVPDMEGLQQMIAQGATMLRAMLNQAPASLPLSNFGAPISIPDQSLMTEMPKIVSKQVDYYFLRDRQPDNRKAEQKKNTSESTTASARGAMLTGASAFNVYAV